jgi:WD40 repeat protein
MPAKSPPLPEQTIARIESWIKQGAQVNVDRDKPLASLAPESTFTPPEHYPHALPVSAISATPDGSSVVVDGYGEVLFWNLADSTLTARLPVQGRRVSDIEISSDGNFMAVASGNPGVNGSVQMFVLAPAEIWEQKLNLPLPEMSLDISISPDSRFTLIGTGGGSLILLNNADGKEVFKLDSHAAAITAVAWSKDSSKFYSASRDRTAKSYNAKTGEIIGSFAEHERTVGGVAESYNGAYTLEESGRLSTWIEGISSHIISQDRSFSPRVSKLIRVDNQIMVLEPHKLKVMNHVSEQVPDGTDKEGKPKTKWTNRFENSYQLDAQAKKLMCFSILSSGDQLKVFAGTSDGTVLVWEPAQSKDIQTTLVCRP